MPTLRPQELSGLVVTPTVEFSGNIWSVSIAIDVGVSRNPPPEIVSREDLVVELLAPSDGSLEPIASPDPGPLAVHALRVVQARAEYTFSGGVNTANELKVTLRGDQKLFPMSQTFAHTRCLRREPREGGAFELLEARGGVIARLVPKLPPLFTRGCCVRRFAAPLSVSTDPTVKSELFHMDGEFGAQGRRCRCSCCEYRQFVRGTFSDAAGGAVRFDMPSGPLDPARYCEDGAIDEFGTSKHGFYGHRATSSPGDTYGGTGASSGCNYRGQETSSCPPAESAHLEFIGLIIDRCRGKVVAKREWVVDL
jgi:hypothetical protein